MTFLVVVLIVLNSWSLLRLFKMNQVDLFLKILVAISYFGWSATPLLISLLGYRNAINHWDNYIFCAFVDQLFFLLTYLLTRFFINRFKSPRVFSSPDFQYSRQFVNFIILFGFISVLFSIYYKIASGETYLEANDISEIDNNAGTLAFISGIGIFSLVGSIIAYGKQIGKIKFWAILALLSVYYVITVLYGARIYMFVFIIVLLYFAIKGNKKWLLIGTVSLSILAFILLPVMAELRSSGIMSVSEVKNSQKTSIDEVVDQIYTKTNSVYYGSYLIEHDGIAGGGPLVYVSTIYSLIPRSIMPNKPQPGSKNGTMYGLPSRLAAIYMSRGDYNNILNVGVPVSIESLWALGWVSYAIQIFASALMLFMFNNILLGKKIFFIYCMLAMIKFPVCNMEISLVQILIQIPRFAILYFIFYLIFGRYKPLWLK